MTVDPDCSVAISSLSEGECSPTTTTDPLTVAEDMGDINITPIIAGAVVAAAVLIIAVTMFAIIFKVLKNCHGEPSLKRTDQM